MPGPRETPKIIIDSVVNKTPHPLVFTDRRRYDSSYVLPANRGLNTNYDIGNYVNMSADDTDAFSRDAQFSVKVANPASE